WCTRQPPSPSGSATRALPSSSASSTRSSTGLRISKSPAASWPRRSHASSIRRWCWWGMRSLAGAGRGCAESLLQGGAQRIAGGIVQHGAAAVGQDEEVFHTLAEGGNARVVHAHARLVQDLGHFGQQARSIAAD